MCQRNWETSSWKDQSILFVNEALRGPRLTINWAKVHKNDTLHSDLTRYAGSLAATETCYAKGPLQKLPLRGEDRVAACEQDCSF